MSSEQKPKNIFDVLTCQDGLVNEDTTKLAREFIESGGDPFERDSDGYSVLDYAEAMTNGRSNSITYPYLFALLLSEALDNPSEIERLFCGKSVYAKGTDHEWEVDWDYDDFVLWRDDSNGWLSYWSGGEVGKRSQDNAQPSLL